MTMKFTSLTHCTWSYQKFIIMYTIIYTLTKEHLVFRETLLLLLPTKAISTTDTRRSNWWAAGTKYTIILRTLLNLLCEIYILGELKSTTEKRQMEVKLSNRSHDHMTIQTHSQVMWYRYAKEHESQRILFLMNL